MASETERLDMNEKEIAEVLKQGYVIRHRKDEFVDQVTTEIGGTPAVAAQDVG